jgi:hypothetical protein
VRPAPWLIMTTAFETAFKPDSLRALAWGRSFKRGSDYAADGTLKRLYRLRWFTIGLNACAVLVAIVAPIVAAGLYLVMTALLLIEPLAGLRCHRRSRARK